MIRVVIKLSIGIQNGHLMLKQQFSSLEVVEALCEGAAMNGSFIEAYDEMRAEPETVDVCE